jgi:hypothetical protein
LEDVQKTMLPSIDPAPKSATEESESLDAQSR